MIAEALARVGLSIQWEPSHWEPEIAYLPPGAKGKWNEGRTIYSVYLPDSSKPIAEVAVGLHFGGIKIGWGITYNVGAYFRSGLEFRPALGLFALCEHDFRPEEPAKIAANVIAKKLEEAGFEVSWEFEGL